MSGKPVLAAGSPAVPASRAQFSQSLASSRDTDTRGFAVLTLCPDQFRVVNETFGHPVGDGVLERIGDRIRSTLRRDDRLLSLPGGEFAVLLLSILSPEEVRATITRVQDVLQRTYLLQNQQVNITVSIGVAISAQGQEQPDTLIRRATIALKSAKMAGPGSVQFFEKFMEDQMVTRHTLALDLKKALLLRQFEVHYQPQVDMRTEELTGFEALLRWKHPSIGWIPPAEFIPLAEELGLIGPIGDWVLRTACKQAAALPESIVIAVNASPLQFANGSFRNSVESALQSAALPARRLEIEITEGLLLRNETGVLATLNDLREIGVRLAMDDFGTGYSSLGKLAELPFNTIKIDRSLVGGSTKQRAIVRAITTLGRGIGMSTLVEGIETREQFADAQSDGCQSAQGYLFGKARPSSQMDQVLEGFSQGVYRDLKRGA